MSVGELLAVAAVVASGGGAAVQLRHLTSVVADLARRVRTLELTLARVAALVPEDQ